MEATGIKIIISYIKYFSILVQISYDLMKLSKSKRENGTIDRKITRPASTMNQWYFNEFDGYWEII